ncbi:MULTISPECIES: hypothetical protein [unclassified Streptomyces]|uniref:hypothetical protein n=1 Tax=unclassified Streptomyces TaxID=2593676 RepID=UPI0036E53C77
MTSPVALPAAALRVVRAAAGRRALNMALRVMLLAGGLVMFGLLCGGRAHAAEGVLPPTEAAGEQAVHATAHAPDHGSVPAPVHASVPAQAAHRTSPASGSRAVGAARDQAVEPARSRLAEPARTHVTEPVRTQVAAPVVREVREAGEVRGTVQGAVREEVREVGEFVGGLVGGLAAEAPPRFLPGPPSVPGVPGIPGQIGEPGAPTQPGNGAHAAPAPGAGTQAAAGHSDGARPGKREAAVPVGDVFAPAGYDAVRARTPAAKAAGTSIPAPAPAFPSGSTVGQSAGDGSSTRHSDLAAAAFGSGATARLLPGATAPSHAAPTRDRHRDIPEFPG